MFNVELVKKQKNIFFFLLDDAICKDFLQIMDLNTRWVFFKNCSEIIKPIEILSESNDILVNTMNLKQ